VDPQLLRPTRAAISRNPFAVRTLGGGGGVVVVVIGVCVGA
jgi:hypothetical protein